VCTAGTSKSAAEVRDHVVKFIENDDGIIIVKSAGEAAWQMNGAGGQAAAEIEPALSDDTS